MKVEIKFDLSRFTSVALVVGQKILLSAFGHLIVPLVWSSSASLNLALKSAKKRKELLSRPLFSFDPVCTF